MIFRSIIRDTSECARRVHLDCNKDINLILRGWTEQHFWYGGGVGFFLEHLGKPVYNTALDDAKKFYDRQRDNMEADLYAVSG